MDPYGAVIKDGKIYARGSSDDKGPTMAAYYAMKLVKEQGLPLKKRVRLILGTDEESGWRCVEHYFKKEEMPDTGFVPDANFPIIHAEKGIANFDIVQVPGNVEEEPAPGNLLVSFQSGRRYNMVPDFAEARLKLLEGASDIREKFDDYLEKNGLTGTASASNDEVVLTMVGVSAHGAEPQNGINAGTLLARF